MKKILVQIFLVFFTTAINAYEIEDTLIGKSYNELVENTIEQLDYLVERNHTENGLSKKNKPWYIYIAGGTLDSLKYYINESEQYYIDKTDGRETRAEFLKNLNERLIELNSYNSTAVYIAFTDYERKILSPIFPTDKQSLAEREGYIKELINKEDYSQRSKKELETYLVFSEAFKDLVIEVYNGSKLSSIDKPNILMPFTNYSIREIIRAEGAELDYIEKRALTYTLYTPKLEEPLNKGKLKTIYNNTDAAVGISGFEQKISKIVESIKMYFHGDFPYKECEELLAEYRNKPIMTEFPAFRELAESNPCVLKNIVPWGEDIEKSEWMTMTETLIVIPLYAALAIPASSVAGSEALRQIGKQKAKDIAVSVATNVAIQTTMNYYFGGEEISKIIDSQERWQRAFETVNKIEVMKEIVDAAVNLNTRQKLIIACLENGIKIENINWDSFDPSDAKIYIDFQGCATNVLKYVFIDAPTDKALGYVFKRLSTLAKNNPKEFVEAWRELFKDFGPTIRQDFKNGYAQYKDDLFKALGITSLNQSFAKYISASFDVENAIAEAVEEYAKKMGGASARQFESTIKDAAVETDLIIKEARSITMASGTSRKITKQGANISLDFNINGKGVKIYATLLEKLDDGNYRIVFVNPPSSGTSSVDGFINNTTKNRKEVINALNDGTTSFSPTARGANASKLDIDGKEIEITEIELRTQRSDGKFEKEAIVSNRINSDVDGLLSNLKKKLGNRLDDAQWQKFTKDFENDAGLLKYFDENPDLVDAWKVIDDAGVDDLIRKNVDNLDGVSKHLDKGVHSANDIKTGLGNTTNKQKWVEDLKDGVYRNGNKAEYVNPSGNVLKWTDQHPNSVNQSIGVALNSTNPGKAVEGKVGDFVKNQGKDVEGFGLKLDNSTLGGQAGDIDVLTKKEIIEIKKSYSSWSSKPNQVEKFTDLTNPQYLNPHGRKPILYIDESLTVAQKADILSIIPSEVTLVNSLDELKSILQ